MSRAPMPSNPLPFLRRLFPERRSDIVALLAICGMTAGLGVMLWRVYDMQTNPSPQLVEHMGARQSRVTEIARRELAATLPAGPARPAVAVPADKPPAAPR